MKTHNIVTTYPCGDKTPKVFNMNNHYREWLLQHAEDKTPKVFKMNNPVQAEGAARGRKQHAKYYNPVGVEPWKIFFLLLACQFIMLCIQAQGFTILYPKDGAELPFNRDVPDEYFTFMWSDTNLVYAPYDIKIAEITGTQTPQEALDNNPPVFVMDSLDIFYFNYPWNAPVLEEKKSYAFSVTGVSESDTVIKIIEFSINNGMLTPIVFEWRRANQYALLQESLDGSVHAGYDKRVRIKYRENYEVSLSQNLRYAIYDAQRRLIVKTDESGSLGESSSISLVSIRYGENYVEINLETHREIKTRQPYYLEVWNEKGQYWYLRFMCDYSIAIGKLYSNNFFEAYQ